MWLDQFLLGTADRRTRSKDDCRQDHGRLVEVVSIGSDGSVGELTRAETCMAFAWRPFRHRDPSMFVRSSNPLGRTNPFSQGRK